MSDARRRKSKHTSSLLGETGFEQKNQKVRFEDEEAKQTYTEASPVHPCPVVIGGVNPATTFNGVIYQQTGFPNPQFSQHRGIYNQYPTSVPTGQAVVFPTHRYSPWVISQPSVTITPQQINGMAADYQNTSNLNTGLSFQPQVPDTTYGPIPHTYVPRFDGGAMFAHPVFPVSYTVAPRQIFFTPYPIAMPAMFSQVPMVPAPLWQAGYYYASPTLRWAFSRRNGKCQRC